MIAERLETLVIARVVASAQPLSDREVAKALQRFAPASYSEAAWCERVVAARVGLSTVPDRNELARRIGKHATARWPQLADRVLPALALGLSADDAARLGGRDEWTAAIAGRALGLWTAGRPPTLAAVCDAYAWMQLGLAGKPKRCPPEVRAVFFQRELQSDGGPPDRLARLYAARALDAPRPELRALRDALVRNWLVGRTLALRAHDFATQVRDAARATTHGMFGDRKVFISSVWDAIRTDAAYASLSLADFKARLVRAHRDGDVLLARADLVAAMDPALVAASEITVDGASFHFIVREERT